MIQAAKDKLKGLEKLKEAVSRDLKAGEGQRCQEQLDWIIDRAKHYEEKTGISYLEIIDAWEEARNYWYMNYYQDCNQPLLNSDKVRVFDTVDDYKKAVGIEGFTCPKCEHVSLNPYECDSVDCDWKSYGLLGTMGKGIFIFVKDKMQGQEIFMPVKFVEE